MISLMWLRPTWTSRYYGEGYSEYSSRHFRLFEDMPNFTLEQWPLREIVQSVWCEMALPIGIQDQKQNDEYFVWPLVLQTTFAEVNFMIDR